ncbi:hypothetical protein [Clostridium felsineum]|uniref:hypothetical protein n=1 Tax=Clostridium felsineum TaxID=36839 RepID=UPI00098C310A|nr:hypothetical protein [Clostridium felsineum]URZ15472.1 hypothetical protein CLFE_015120 [Clostridium felsineum DSM 794]
MNLLTEKSIYTEGEAYIDSVIDDKCLGWLLPILETGETACKAFMNLNSEFFNCKDYLNMVPGHLLSYCINKQLSTQSLISSCPFISYKEVINKRNGYAIPILGKENVTISVMRSSKQKQVDLSDRRYLKEKCISNDEIDSQLSMFNECNQDYYKKDKYHGVLLYGTKKDWEGIEFADIIFFDSKLKRECYSLDLVNRLHIYESTMSNEEKNQTLLNAKNLINNEKSNLEAE